jgi:hypothetical protein
MVGENTRLSIGIQDERRLGSWIFMSVAIRVLARLKGYQR